MTSKEMMISILDMLNEEQLRELMLYAETYLHPNEETLAAMTETEDILAHPENYKGYTSVDEMMEDILNGKANDNPDITI